MATPPPGPGSPDAPPRAIPAIAWGPGGVVGKWAFLVHAGAARLEVTGDWVRDIRPAGDDQWRPVACAFAQGGGKLRVGRFFEGIIDNVRLYGRELGAAERAALLGVGDLSALDWQRRYFAGAPSDGGTDEDGDVAALWRESVRDGQPFMADSPVMQLMPQITADHREICFNRRMAGAHSLDYQIEASADLAHWTPLAGKEISVRPSPDLPGFEEVIFRADLPMAGGRPLYARVQAP